MSASILSSIDGVPVLVNPPLPMLPAVVAVSDGVAAGEGAELEEVVLPPTFSERLPSVMPTAI